MKFLISFLLFGSLYFAFGHNVIKNSCNYKDHDIGDVGASNENDCASKCAAHERCTHFTWVPTSSRGGPWCWMKYADNLPEVYASHEIAQDPLAFCGHIEEKFPAESIPKLTISTKCDYKGNNLSNELQNYVQGCASRCYENPSCTHFTWDTETYLNRPICYLKNAASLETALSSNLNDSGAHCGYITEGRFGVATPPPMTPVPDEQTYSSPQPVEQLTFSPPDSSPKFTISTQCDYKGNDLSDELQNDVQGCASRCYENPSCTHFTFDTETYLNRPICYLKHAASLETALNSKLNDSGAQCGYITEGRFGVAAPPPMTPVPDEQTYSSPQPVEQFTFSPPDSSQKFTISTNCDYKGNDLSDEVQNDVQGCASGCYENTLCTHFTWDTETSLNRPICYLKNAASLDIVLNSKLDDSGAQCGYITEGRFGVVTAPPTTPIPDEQAYSSPPPFEELTFSPPVVDESSSLLTPIPDEQGYSSPLPVEQLTFSPPAVDESSSPSVPSKGKGHHHHKSKKTQQR